MSNIGRARALIRQLGAAGTKVFCVCAGSRNSPLLAVLGASDLHLYSFFDERSAAFFALGRIKRDGIPVAVITTSGTAVAELLPATIEAHYSSLPLVLVTADRPARFRGSGAPQCIEQEGIFGPYAETAVDSWTRCAPLHINIEFDEPLIDEEPGTLRLPESAPLMEDRHSCLSTSGADRQECLSSMERPLVILGQLATEDRDRVAEWTSRLGAPIYAEALSGLREDPRIAPLAIRAGERMIARGGFDGVIRIGGVPTLRFWRDLEHSQRELPVVSFSSSQFVGLTRGEIHPIDHLPVMPRRERVDDFLALDAEKATAIGALLDEEPHSEPALFRRISLEIGVGARVYLGNSLPIREWDLFASWLPRQWSMEGNRGANGIDGQLSTFLGWCAAGAENVAIVGDLTAMYDLNAPWVVPQLAEDIRFRIIAVNNGGGKIFSRVGSLSAMSPEVRSRIVENSHDVSLEHWAAMWRLPYNEPDAERGVIELRPDAGATKRFWGRYDSLW